MEGYSLLHLEIVVFIGGLEMLAVEFMPPRKLPPNVSSHLGTFSR